MRDSLKRAATDIYYIFIRNDPKKKTTWLNRAAGFIVTSPVAVFAFGVAIDRLELSGLLPQLVIRWRQVSRDIWYQILGSHSSFFSAKNLDLLTLALFFFVGAALAPVQKTSDTVMDLFDRAQKHMPHLKYFSYFYAYNTVTQLYILIVVVLAEVDFKALRPRSGWEVIAMVASLYLLLIPLPNMYALLAHHAKKDEHRRVFATLYPVSLLFFGVQVPLIAANDSAGTWVATTALCVAMLMIWMFNWKFPFKVAIYAAALVLVDLVTTLLSPLADHIRRLVTH